jgi:hypothetical protein
VYMFAKFGKWSRHAGPEPGRTRGHRVAIANNRLIAFDEQGVTFKWKDYRIEGRDRYRRMTLATNEFIRHPRAAQRLPPHPPLRPVRQRLLRRQHRPRA